MSRGNRSESRDEAPPTTRRVAILHYTAAPAIGGIESLMARQCTVLERLGHQAICVVGRGSVSPRFETIQISAMDPSNVDVERSRRELSTVAPSPHHATVCELVNRLGSALNHCTDCWILNALTVSLNPFLTRALEVLIERRLEIHWVAWCADLSSTSRFVQQRYTSRAPLPPAVSDRVSWVAISHARSRELSAALDIPAHLIRVVPPPLDVLDWLNVGSQARTVIETTRLLESDPVVLVPAKALPHKGLPRAVGVAAALARGAPRVRVLLTTPSSPHEPDLSLHVRDRLRSAISDAGVQHAVQLLPDLLGEDPSDRTVRELMQLSDVVFLPSVEEGFGMPLLEAAACRVPVVCTDIPAFREVAGDSALYFGEEWDDERVGSLVATAAGLTRNRQRRAAVTSLRRFESDLEDILRMSGYPKV